MRESLPPSKDPQAAISMRGIRWDALAAIIASLVGLLALLVSGYTAYIQKQQVRAQVWPYLEFEYSDVAAHYTWTNKGVGPAIVESVEVFVDGKPQRSWKSVQSALRISPFHYYQSTLNDTVISAGQTLEWLKFQNLADYASVHAASAGRLGFKVCYCSTLDDCWMNDSTRRGKGDNRVPVEQCSAVPDTDQFDD